MIETMLRQRDSAYERVLDDDAVEERLIDVDNLSERELSNRQFAFPKRPFPIKEVVLGVVLLVAGALLTMVGLLSLAGLGNESEGSSVAFLFLGLLTLTPGSYASWIAYNSWRRVPGYSFDQMPQVARHA